MKNGNTFMHVQITVIIAILTLFVTYFIVDQKTSNIADEVANQILAIEYDKVGGKINYEKITAIQKEQIIASLNSYESQGNTIPTDTSTQAVPSTAAMNIDTLRAITTDGTYILGNPDAEITFIEYSDLECPFCKKLHESGTIDQILEDYDGKVNFIFKQFALDFHIQAPMEAEAALCVGELAGSQTYYDFIEAVFAGSKTNGNSYTKESVSELGATLGINQQELLSCIESGRMTERVQAELSEGRDVFGITGTPGNVLINNQTGEWDKLPGAYPLAAFKEKIDALLQ